MYFFFNSFHIYITKRGIHKAEKQNMCTGIWGKSKKIWDDFNKSPLCKIAKFDDP